MVRWAQGLTLLVILQYFLRYKVIFTVRCFGVHCAEERQQNYL